MRNASWTILSAANTADATGAQQDSGQWVSASFQYIFGDATAVGSLIIQGSNDPDPKGTLMPFVAQNWTAIPNGTAAITAGGSGYILVPNMAYRFIRAFWDYTSGGSSTVVVNVNALSC
jgi:hypothetical protein